MMLIALAPSASKDTKRSEKFSGKWEITFCSVKKVKKMSTRGYSGMKRLIPSRSTDGVHSSAFWLPVSGKWVMRWTKAP